MDLQKAQEGGVNILLKNHPVPAVDKKFKK